MRGRHNASNNDTDSKRCLHGNVTPVSYDASLQEMPVCPLFSATRSTSRRYRSNCLTGGQKFCPFSACNFFACAAGWSVGGPHSVVCVSHAIAIKPSRRQKRSTDQRDIAVYCRCPPRTANKKKVPARRPALHISRTTKTTYLPSLAAPLARRDTFLFAALR